MNLPGHELGFLFVYEGTNMIQQVIDCKKKLEKKPDDLSG